MLKIIKPLSLTNPWFIQKEKSRLLSILVYVLKCTESQATPVVYLQRNILAKLTQLAKYYLFGNTGLVIILKNKNCFTSLTLFEDFGSNFHFE